MILKDETEIRVDRGATALSLLLVVLSSCLSQPRAVKVPRVKNPRPAAVQASLAGEWVPAAHYWREVFELSKGTDLRACLESAQAMSNLKDYEGASNILQLGLDEYPNNPDLLACKGDALVALGFRRSAEACYERCLEVSPNRIPVLCALGHLRLTLDRETAAVGPLQRALDLGCDKLSTRERLATAYRDSGRPAHAWVLYVSRMNLDPPASPEFVTEAACLALDPALLATHPDATAVALVWLECCLLLNPNHTEAHFQHGVLSEAIGNSLDAIDSYRRAIETQPSFLPALTNLALLFAELQHEGPCREMVARAVELESDHDRRIALWDLLGRFE